MRIVAPGKGLAVLISNGTGDITGALCVSRSKEAQLKNYGKSQR